MKDGVRVSRSHSFESAFLSSNFVKSEVPASSIYSAAGSEEDERPIRVGDVKARRYHKNGYDIRYAKHIHG